MAHTRRSPARDPRTMIDGAAAADGPAEALSLLLDAWRLEPAGAIRELVLLASKLSLPDAAPASPAMETKEWNALEKKRDPVTLPRLAAAVAVESPTEALRRLSVLSRWPADPRLVDAILSWIARPPIQTAAADAKKFWALAFRMLEESGDRALSTAISSLDPEGSATTVIFLRSQLSKLYASLSGTRPTRWTPWDGPRAAEPEPPLDPKLSATIAAAKTRFGEADSATGAKKKTNAQTEESLLAAVYADPAADEPRLVYADWLQQRGDPWGELIVLQIADAKGKGSAAARNRIDALIAKHAAARYEGLPVVWKPIAHGMIQPARCARGFLVYGEIWCPVVRRREGPAHGDPRWGTVEALRFVAGDPKTILEDASDPVKVALRSVTNLSPAAAVAVAKKRPARLDEIGVEVDDPAEAARDLAALGGAAWLRSLVLECPIDRQPTLIETILSGPLRAVPRIEIGGRTWGSKDPWRIHLERERPRVEVELRRRITPDAAATLSRAVAAAAAGAELSLRSAVPLSAKSVPPLLAQIFGARAPEAVWKTDTSSG